MEIKRWGENNMLNSVGENSSEKIQWMDGWMVCKF